MGKSVVVNLTVPKRLEEKIASEASDFLSQAELVRYAAVRMLMKLRMLPMPEKVKLLQKLLKPSEPFDEEKELARLRRVREELWEEKHGKSGS